MENEGSGVAQGQASNAAKEEQTTPRPESNEPASEGPKYLVDAKELITSEVNGALEKLRESVTKEVTEAVVASVNEQLKEKIAIEIATNTPRDPGIDWMEKIVDMASKKKFFNFK